MGGGHGHGHDEPYYIHAKCHKLAVVTRQWANMLRFGLAGKRRAGVGSGVSNRPARDTKHMYNLDRMRYRRLKMSLAVFSAFSIGIVVPIYAVYFQQKKTASA